MINSTRKKNKILVILGPTTTGKSELAIKLARKYNGEVISADSRQVYKGLDIGTGKITKKEMSGIPHHMLDVVSPSKVFTVAEWKKQTEKIIADIISRGKLPIICGGTGFYIKSIVDNVTLPEVPPNIALRKKLERKTVSGLFSMLKKLDPKRAKNIAKEQGSKNPVRLIRAIEIATALGKVPEMRREKSNCQFLQIGLTLPDIELKKRIHIRLFARIRDGMVTEAKKLHANRLSWKRMRELGLEYRYLANLLENKQPLKASSDGHTTTAQSSTGYRMTNDKQELITKLETEIWHYAKRQITWFKKDKRIKWYSTVEMKKIEKEVRKFIA